MKSSLELADDFISMISTGDVTKVVSCCSPDLVVWHNYDNLDLTMDQFRQAMSQFIARFPVRSYKLVRQAAFDGGAFRQFVLSLETKKGVKITTPGCLVFSTKDGAITRIEEYLHVEPPAPQRAPAPS